MAPKFDNAEGIVLNFINEQNRPLNLQNVADALQKFSLKKLAVQKALDSLSESRQISFKEYGKQKIYIARQDQFKIPNSEELDQMKNDSFRLQKELEVQRRAVGDMESEIRVLQANLTLEQICHREATLTAEVKEMEDKLKKLREGKALVKPEDRKLVEDKYHWMISQWRKRKRIFKDMWDSLTENNPKDPMEFKEELGIEYDEDVGMNIQQFCELVACGNKRSRS